MSERTPIQVVSDCIRANEICGNTYDANLFRPVLEALRRAAALEAACRRALDDLNNDLPAAARRTLEGALDV